MSLSYETPGSNLDLDIPKAPQACLSCRKQKRKCNKALPACSLCERMSRPCDYSNASPAPTSEDFNALRQKLMELESRLNDNNGSSLGESSPYMPTPSTGPLTGGTDNLGMSTNTVYIQQDPAYQNVPNRFPAIAFLDTQAFKYGQVAVPKAVIDIPLEVLELLGDGSAVQVVITDYFATIHTWMPIVSKKRLTGNMLNPMWEAGPDLAILFLCMKLIITRPQDGLESHQHPIYMAAKRFLALTEASGLASIMILQAHILVAIYEIGQAIYPAAWMSVGACVRYGLLLGINDHESSAKLLGRVDSWTELEERKRVWYGVMIIDRVVSVGGQGRFLACEDPKPRAHLPIDTTMWDGGHLTPAPSLNMSSSFAETASAFARLCQASTLLGTVLRHHYSRSDLPEIKRFRDASEIYLQVSELARQLAHEATTSEDYLSLTAPLAICFTALCSLCDPYACVSQEDGSSNSPEEATMQMQAIEGIKTVSSSIKDFSEQIIARTPHSLDIDRVSPFILDSMYAGAANFAWLVRESGDENSQMALESLRHCLRRLGGRWRSAAEYLRILEAQEFTYAVGNVAP